MIQPNIMTFVATKPDQPLLVQQSEPLQVSTMPFVGATIHCYNQALVPNTSVLAASTPCCVFQLPTGAQYMMLQSLTVWGSALTAPDATSSLRVGLYGNHTSDAFTEMDLICNFPVGLDNLLYTSAGSVGITLPTYCAIVLDGPIDFPGFDSAVLVPWTSGIALASIVVQSFSTPS